MISLNSFKKHFMMLLLKNEKIKVYWKNLEALTLEEKFLWQKNIPLGISLRKQKEWNSMTEVAPNEKLKYGALAVLAEKNHVDWSLSQSAHYVLVGYSEKSKIGVDIERTDRPGHFSEFGLTSRELKFVKSLCEPEMRKFAYLFYWVQKEALYKCGQIENFKPEKIESYIECESKSLNQFMTEDFILEKDSMVLFKKGKTIGAISWAL